ncbi:MFS transporter [Streptomyces sp. NPDC013455]|uniref:MFS transporter n=1 Tax=Streptomyces sp. NPDC013455 TaxID=3155605 RepID=UPI0033DDFD8F
MTGYRGRRFLFGTGVLAGLLAEQLVLFAVPLLIYQETGKVSTLGTSFALEWLPALMAYPFAGLLADRDGGTRLFSRANTARSVVLVCTLVLCVAMPSWTVGLLMANGALLATVMPAVRMSVEKVVPQLAQGDDLPRTQALFQNMELLATALGPGLAVVAATALGKLWLLALAAALFATGAACWLGLPRLKPAASGGTDVRAIFGDLGLGFRLLVTNRPVVLLAGLNFIINLAFATMLSANAAVVTGELDAPESGFALLNTLVGIAGMANLALTPRLVRRFGLSPLGAAGYATQCVALLVLGFASSFAVYAAAFVVGMVGVAYFNVYNRTERVKIIPGEHLGKVMGPFFLLGLSSYPIGGLLTGTLGPVIGPQRLVAALAVLLAAVGVIAVPLTIRSFRRALAEKERAEATASTAATAAEAAAAADPAAAAPVASAAPAAPVASAAPVTEAAPAASVPADDGPPGGATVSEAPTASGAPTAPEAVAESRDPQEPGESRHSHDSHDSPDRKENSRDRAPRQHAPVPTGGTTGGGEDLP